MLAFEKKVICLLILLACEINVQFVESEKQVNPQILFNNSAIWDNITLF